MAAISLSRQDIDILGKILDPESGADGALRLDVSLPKDPHMTDADEYARVSQREKELVLALQQADMELAGLETRTLPDPVATFQAAVASLAELVSQYPQYASARNNRAQALRRLYGDDMLMDRAEGEREGEGERERESAAGAKPSTAILQGDAATSEARAQAAATVLSDLDKAIALLMPAASSAAALSPTANKTLSQALTQRAALYYATSKHMASGRSCNSRVARPEAAWSKADFEEAAARDFDLGGRFGNDLARQLAVGINPTAKLCGQMVQQMMKDEYDPAY